MKQINTRYGASVDLSVTIDDPLATSASLYVGMEGQVPLITKTATFTDKFADLSLDPEETEIPLNTYKYQINVSYSDGRLEKFPTSGCDDDDLPEFIVSEALDEQEIS